MGKLRKRFLVSEGDFKQLWFNVQEVRNTERKTTFETQFKQLLNNATQVKLVAINKGGKNG